MEPPPLQSSEIVSSSSMSALSPSNDDNQPKVEQQQDLPTQSPNFAPTDSDPVQNLSTQTLESKNSDPSNLDHDFPPLEPEESEDQKSMTLSPSHQPSISDVIIEEEREVLPQSASSSRRPVPAKRKKGFAKNNWKFVAAVEKKVQTLSQKFNGIPFVPSKALDFSRHENNLRKLGLWDFAHLEFDKKIRADLLTQLIATYNEKNRYSYVVDFRIRVTQSDLGRALNLPKKPVNCGEEVWPADFILFLEEFVSSWMLLHEDTWMLPSEVMHWTGLIKEGSLEKLDFGKLIWFMVKRELSKGVHLEDCYYASHLQHLIKVQKEGLLMTKIPDEVDEILVVKDDEEEVTDVIMTECDEPPSHGGEPEMNPANVQPSVGSITDVQSHQSVENVGEAKIVSVVVHGDGTGECDGLVENPETCEFEKVGDPVESVDAAGYHHAKSPETNCDHVKNLDTPGNLSNPEKADEHTKDWEPVVDHVKDLETSDDHVKDLETSDDHVEDRKTVFHGKSLETSGDNVESLEPPDDHVENLETPGEHVENQETAGDFAQNWEKVVDHVDNMEVAGDDLVENMDTIKDNAEKMEIDGDNMEDTKVTGDFLDDIKTETDVADDSEIQESRGNDLMNFGECKEDEQVSWDLQNCRRQRDGEPEDIEDDEGEDDENVEGFDILQKCNSFSGLSSGHMMQAIDPSQIPYAPHDFGDQSSIDLDNHMMLGGPSSSLFGNAQKRELDLDPEIPGHSLNESHKRMRSDGPSWDQKPPDMEWCMDQLHQLAGKTRMAYMSYQQATMNQQQVLFNEIEAKDRVIQQLNMSIGELQRRQELKLARYDNELFAMTKVIDGYRRALRSNQLAFAEYRKRAKLPLEPLYKDAGEGGVVKSVAQLEREQLKREEEERVARILFAQKCELLEKEWEMTFQGHMEHVENLGARLSGIEKGVEDLKESTGKRKDSETVG